LENLGLGEKGVVEMLAPVSIRRLTLCFSTVSIAWGSYAFMVVTKAWMGSSRTIIGWEVLALVGLKIRQSPRGSFF
jgi:hypothetical protein